MSEAEPVSGAEMVTIPRAGQAGMTARQTASGNELTWQAETASAAIAERARAKIEMQYTMARRFPRNLDRARVEIMKACSRPKFAEKAIYHKPIGDGVEGPSIRMLEQLTICMTNIATEVTTIYDDQQKRIIEVAATDLETNVTHPATISLDKTVERSDSTGRQVLGQRINSLGKITYIVAATDDEILNKQNALVSKALRTCLTRLMPYDLLAEGMRAAYKTRETQDAQDPDAAKKAVVDNFVSIGVLPEQICDYLGHSLDVMAPKELDTLRSLYQAIRDGEATWSEAIEGSEAKRETARKASDKVKAAAETAGAAPALPPKPASLGEAAARTKAQQPASKTNARPAETTAQTKAEGMISGPPPAASPAKKMQVLGADGKPLVLPAEGQPPPSESSNPPALRSEWASYTPDREPGSDG